MADQLTDYMAGRKPAGFTSQPYFSKPGDFLSHFFRDEDHYAERVDGFLTVYKSIASDETVGFKVKGIEHLVREFGEYSLSVHDSEGNLLVGPLLFGAASSATDQKVKTQYKQVATRAKDTRVPHKYLSPALPA